MPSVLNVSLALTCVESALYGIFFVLAMTSLVVLIARHGRDASGTSPRFSFSGVLSSPLVIATVTLLLTVSAHWLVTVRRLFYAFNHGGGSEAATFFSTVEDPSQVAATAFVVASVIVGDIILTYRIWAIWERRFAMIIFPTLCTMGYAASGISVVQLFATFTPGESVFVVQSQRRIIITAAWTLSTNIYGTVSIAYRIWTTNRSLKNERTMVSGLSMAEALIIFVESAALYTSWTLFFLIAYTARSPLESFALHCIPAATGISFMLIIVRVGLGFSWTEPAPLSRLSHPQCHSAHPSHSHPPEPVRMIALSVTRTVEHEAVTDFALPRGDGRRESEDSIYKAKEAARDMDRDLELGLGKGAEGDF